MTFEQWEKVKAIVQAALEIEPERRAHFVDENCGGDDFLRREVESLLASYDNAGDFIEKPAFVGKIEISDADGTSTQITPGKQIGRYEIHSLIGRGGMGEIYLAEDTRLKRQVALKVLPSGVAADENRIRGFVQEAMSASALNHPNIITIHEFGETEDTQFMVTELVEGETLRSLIKSRQLDLREILDIAIQLASALSAAHSAGIVHRDIKPENVMLRKDGYVKVLDFGLAKLTEPKSLGEEDRTLLNSTPGIIRGTVAYMSPEQARGLKVDNRTDIWSFGVMLYELLTWRPPFSGETTTDLMLSIIQKEPPSLELIAPSLPNELYFIVNKTLRKKLDERYQSIKDVQNDLRRVKQRLDYDEIERTLSPEDSKARNERQQKETAVLAAVSSDAKEAISTRSTSSAENLPQNNLSTELSPLIGREIELEEIRDLLRQSDVRLLTITGVGGTGKTRLAQAIAHESLAEFTDGVYFINLSTIENSELVLPIIAQTLGIREESGKTLKEKLREFLRERRMLIILDNFEQITEAAPQIGELLSGSENLKILVTSRVRLNLRFEHEFPLQPLSVPDDKNLSVDQLAENPAIELFIERAQAVKPEFALSEENAQAIAEICQSLDGLPLAIELAAVRVKLLAPKAILTRLSNSLKLLTGGARDLPERQQTMRGAIQWSYDLLDEEEKKLLNRLAVFSGGFTLEAAEAVANVEDLSLDLLDAAASLVDKSLLSQREQSDGEPRFRMLVVVREFALESLEASGEAVEIKHTHAEFFAALTEEAKPELMGAKTVEWMDKLETEHDNLRAALEWSLENKPEIALRIVGAIMKFWDRRGYLAEGIKWTKQGLEKSGEDSDPKLRASAYRTIGGLSNFQGNYEEASLFLEEGLRLSREIGDKQTIAVALNNLAMAKMGKEDLSSARALYEESLAIAREIDDKIQAAVTLNNIGHFLTLEKEDKAACEYFEEGYKIAKQESYQAGVAISISNLAGTAIKLGDYQSARSYALEALDLNEKLGFKHVLADTLCSIAALAVKAGEMEKAARLLGAQQSIYDATGFKPDKTTREFIDRFISEAREAMGDEAFEAAFREGQKMRLKKAVALARDVD